MDNTGIKGTLYWVEGNQMPMMMDENEPGEMERMEKVSVSRTIHIYELTSKSNAIQGEDGLFQSVDSKLVKAIKTDQEGNFVANLPPGEYSFFTVEETGLFANIFDGKNHIHPFKVNKGEWTEMNVEINYRAVY